MNIAKLFGYGFVPSKMLTARKERWWKFLILYILMFFISVLPFTLAIIKEGGFKLNFTSDLSSDNVKTLPGDLKRISITGIESNKDNISFYEGNTSFLFSYDKDFKLEDFNNKAYLESIGLKDFKVGGSLFVFHKEKDKGIVYLTNNRFMQGHYKAFGKTISFTEYNTSTPQEKVEIMKTFEDQLQSAFKHKTILFSLMTFLLTQIGLYAALFLILAALLQFFRFGFSYFMKYGECLKILVLSMIYPSIISFIIGFLTHAFMPVIFQFGVPIIIVYTILRYGKKEFDAPTVDYKTPPKKENQIKTEEK